MKAKWELLTVVTYRGDKLYILRNSVLIESLATTSLKKAKNLVGEI